MSFSLKLIIVFFTLTNLLYATPITTSAKYAIVMDYDTKNILYNKAAESRIYPASMSKLMTLYILFEEISEGSITLDSEFLVSKKAWKKGGSKMFVEVGSYVKIKDLLTLNEGSVLELDRLAGDPLDIKANGTLIARGEVVMVGERFGIRFSSIVDPNERVKGL